MTPPQKSAGGFKLPRFGKGNSPILSKNSNRLVDALNPLGNMRVVLSDKDETGFYYSDSNVLLVINRADTTAEAAASLQVGEVDGAPTVTEVDEIQFPNGRVTDLGGGAVRIAFPTALLTVAEVDASPTVNDVNSIQFPNGSVTDLTGGSVSIAFPAVQIVEQFRLKSVQDNYITCRTWDGTTEGSTDVLIAKPFKLRNSIASATIDGVSITYAYTNTVQRVATISGVGDETQVVVPRYLGDDLIYAFKSNNTEVSVSGTELERIDLNCDGRAWAKKYT